MMLSRVFGKRDFACFKEWMFPFIEKILDGKQQFYWAMILSDSVHNQMIKVNQTKTFFMTSYVVYATARMGIFPRLNAVGTLGEAPEQKKACEHYDQLTLQTS